MPAKKNKKIAVFLPIGYKGGTLKGAKNIAKMFYLGSRQAGEPVDVVFSCIGKTYDIEREFSDLSALGIRGC
ncbi:MAG: hypothetical protein HKM04_01405 [Legionellales bacterium]|nr:hypothetical protein [Legionellales bacterium]